MLTCIGAGMCAVSIFAVFCGRWIRKLDREHMQKLAPRYDATARGWEDQARRWEAWGRTEDAAICRSRAAAARKKASDCRTGEGIES